MSGRGGEPGPEVPTMAPDTPLPGRRLQVGWVRKLLRGLEAAPGVEPGNRGFADLRLNHLATPPAISNGKGA